MCVCAAQGARGPPAAKTLCKPNLHYRPPPRAERAGGARNSHGGFEWGCPRCPWAAPKFPAMLCWGCANHLKTMKIPTRTGRVRCAGARVGCAGARVGCAGARVGCAGARVRCAGARVRCAGARVRCAGARVRGCGVRVLRRVGGHRAGRQVRWRAHQPQGSEADPDRRTPRGRALRERAAARGPRAPAAFVVQ